MEKNWFNLQLVNMKRSYGQTGGPPVPAQVGQTTLVPPLPPGPPPPPPSTVPNPYAQPYAYTGYSTAGEPVVSAAGGAQQAAVHPQYPGYGYGGQVQVPTPAPYPNYAPQYGQPPIAPPHLGIQYPQPPYPQPQGYPAYPQPPPPPPPYPPQLQPYPGYLPQVGPPPLPPHPQHNPYAQQGPPPTQQQQQQQQQQQAYPGFNLPSGQPSPGAPPFKRTRYDSNGPPQPPIGPQNGMQASQPPPALPPLNAYTNQGGSGRGGGNSGRGGYNSSSRGGGGGRDSSNVGSYGDRGVGSSSSSSSYQAYGSGSPLSSSGGGGRGGMGSGNGSNYRSSGRGDSRNGPGGNYDSRSDFRNVSDSSSRASTQFARVGSSSIPSGPSSQSRGRGGSTRDRGGRPVVSLPISTSRASSGISRASPGPDLPKGPRAGISGGRGGPSGFSSVNVRTSGRERKWGNSSGGGGGHGSRDEPKRVLTDFRISKLEISEMEWEWKVEAVKAVAALVEEIDSKLEEVESLKEEIVEEQESELAAATTATTATGTFPLPPSSPLLSVNQQPLSSPSKYDMSIDSINPVSNDLPSESVIEESKVKLEEPEVVVDVAPVKKLTKKQKQALAAAAAAANREAEEEKLQGGESKLVEPKVEVIVESTVGGKKDGKHGRDEDEEEDSLVITDVTAKKVKADTGEPVVLEKVEVGKEVLIESLLPEAPVVVSSHTPKIQNVNSAALFVPLGPSSDLNHVPTVRQNSRLRIYFSSPVTPIPIVVSKVPEIAAKVLEEVVAGSDSNEASAKNVEVEKEEESKVKVETEVEEEEDVDGEPMEEETEEEEVETEDVEKEEVEKEEVEPVLAIVEELEESEDDEDSVQSSLLLPRSEIVAVSEEPESEVVEKDTSLNTVETSTLIIPEPQAPLSHLEPEADRISISYAGNTRRLVIDASVVESVKISRGTGRIEVVVSTADASTKVGDVVFPDEFRVCKGILIESLDTEADDYVVIDRAGLELAWGTEEENTDPSESTLDYLLPPMHRFLDAQVAKNEGLQIIDGSSTTFTVVVTLDKANPLTEARWVKTGEVDSWMHSIALDAKSTVSKWKGKITVSDPDPPPTIQHALDTWATAAGNTGASARKAFVSGHMSNFDNVFEILLRLTRGERVIPSHHSLPPQPSSVGALAATLSAPYADSQTQVSLAVLSMFRLSMDSATKAGIPKEEIEKQIGDVIRGIPYHLIFKSLDTMYKEYRNTNNK